MNILVTGGAGFVGSRVTAHLLAAGHSVTVFDNLSTGERHLVPEGATFVQGDLRERDSIAAALPGHDGVIHLAAQAVVPESVENPQKSFDINVVGGFNLIESMRTLGIRRFVYSSTAAVYGNPERVPIHEDDTKLPINPYGATKYAFESLLHAYHASYGFNVMIFRYFNPYGPLEEHTPETHAVPNFIRAALDGRPIPLYWQGQPVRDFFFVDDIARAHVMALDHDGYRAFNLGSGSGVAVKDLVQTIFEISGSTSSVDDLGERPGDPMELFADTARAREELGWEPVTSLQDGLRQTIDGLRTRGK